MLSKDAFSQAGACIRTAFTSVYVDAYSEKAGFVRAM